MNELSSLKNIQVSADSYECTITTDIAVFGYIDDKLKILLTKRSLANYKSHWLLPGGTMEAHETIEECAKKILFTLTGMIGITCNYVKLYSELERHPIKRVVTASFCSLIKPEKHPFILTGNIEDIEWFDMANLPPNIAFDHDKMIQNSHSFLRDKLKRNLLFGELLPKTFTLTELQYLYENILNIKLDKRNFRRRILQMEVLANTGKKKRGVKGGPLLYKYLEG